MTLDCGFENTSVKGHFCELLVSNIIGYLAFCWMDDEEESFQIIPLNHTQQSISLSEIYLVVGDRKKTVSPSGFAKKEDLF